MDAFALTRVIEGWEDLHTEFKQTLPSNESVFYDEAPVAGAGNDLSGDLLDKKDISGVLPEALRDVEGFFGKHLRTAHAVDHRDYTVAEPIRVLIFDDRVEFRTPGRLPNSVTVETMKVGGAYVVRNPTIYNFPSKYGLVTDIGSGVLRTARLLKEAGDRDIGLFETDSEFIVTFPRTPLRGC